MRIEPDQIPRLPEAILAGQDDPPLEFALKLLRDNAPELHTALWRSNFKDQNACAWLAEHVPDHYRPPMNEADEPSEVDMYDVAPVRGTSGEGDESELAEALLFDRQDDQGYVIRKRARPKGRHRVTRLAVRIQGGQRNGKYTPIYNDEAAITEYLERDRRPLTRSRDTRVSDASAQSRVLLPVS